MDCDRSDDDESAMLLPEDNVSDDPETDESDEEPFTRSDLKKGNFVLLKI